MSSYFKVLSTDEGLVHIVTSSRWMAFFPMPHTSVMPHNAPALKRLGTFIKWSTNDAALLATLHDSIVHLVEQVGISGLVTIKNSVKVTERIAKTYGGSWHDIIKQAAQEGVLFPVPEEVLRYIKGFM